MSSPKRFSRWLSTCTCIFAKRHYVPFYSVFYFFFYFVLCFWVPEAPWRHNSWFVANHSLPRTFLILPTHCDNVHHSYVPVNRISLVAYIRVTTRFCLNSGLGSRFCLNSGQSRWPLEELSSIYVNEISVAFRFLNNAWNLFVKIHI